MKTYLGSCHCGAVQFEVTAEIETVLECNCSHCRRKGFLLLFVPRDQFILKSGEDTLTEYLFNKKTIAHQFCKTCGVQGFAYGKAPDGKETAAINVRCLEDVDLESLPHTPFNGRDM